MKALVKQLSDLPRALGFGKELRPELSSQAEWAERYFRKLRAHASLTRHAFKLVVIFPTVIACLYYGLLAPDQYVSEAQFIVRNTSSQRVTGIDRLINTFGISTTVDDGYAVEKYLTSRDALGNINSQLNLREIYRCRGIDVLSCYNSIWSVFRPDSFEAVYDYAVSRISVARDTTRGIVALKVISYSPADSNALVGALLKAAELKVNAMNARAMEDAVSHAERELRRSEDRVLASQEDLTAFRNKQMIVDPGKASASQTTNIAGLEADLALTRAQVDQAEQMAPVTPSMRSMSARVSALQVQIAAERSKLVGSSKDALSNKLTEFERLTLLRNLAGQEFALAMSGLESARDQARQQHIYIEEVVKPNLPDEATEPRRMRSVMTVLVSCFAGFAVIWILLVGAREHAQ